MKHWNPGAGAAANDVLDINEYKLLMRLRELFATFSMPNKTPAADAVHVALLADQRSAGLQTTALNSLTNDQLIDAYCHVVWAVEHGNTPTCQLPFGTEARSRTKGTLEIGAQTYVLDAGSPGLHALETVRRDAHGPNLERLAASIARKTRKLACRRLGVPIPVHVVDANSTYLIQFAPLPEAGNVVLQRNVAETGADRFCAALPDQIEAFAKSIVADMRNLWNRRKEIGARVAEVRAAALAGLPGGEDADGRDSVKAITVDLSRTHDYPVSLHVEYDTLDEAIRPGTVIDFIPANFSLEGRAWPAPRSTEYRREMRARLAALGATGMIDEIAEAIAMAAPEGPAAVLGRLATAYETTALVPTRLGPLYATMFWRDGVIQAELSMPGKLEWFYGRLELNGVVPPAHAVRTLPGRPVARVFDLPFETSALIKHVDMLEAQRICLHLDPAERLVNVETGVIWTDTSVDSFSLRFG